MRGIGVCVLLVGALAGWPQRACAQSLTLDQVLGAVRSRAPEVLAAMARVDEARARMLGASLRLPSNPVVDVDLGPRNGPVGTSMDFSVSVGQAFETGGQRAARIAVVQADVSRATAAADEAARLVIRAAAVAFIRALAVDERLRLLATAETIARQLQDAMERRYQAGDIPALDLNLTRIAAARARAERLRAEAERDDALRPLRTALGVDAGASLTLVGTLDRTPAPRPVLIAAIDMAPAMRQVAAEMDQAMADIRLGQGMRRPDVGARLSVSREQDDRIAMGGLSITLPVFRRGDAVAAEARARVTRLAHEREAARRALQVEVDAGLAAYQRRRAAADLLREDALPAADDNEGLAARSLDAGEINLMELLLVRQDVTAARLAHIDASADAAVAAVEVDASAGVLR